MDKKQQHDKNHHPEQVQKNSKHVYGNQNSSDTIRQRGFDWTHEDPVAMPNQQVEAFTGYCYVNDTSSASDFRIEKLTSDLLMTYVEVAKTTRCHAAEIHLD